MKSFEVMAVSQNALSCEDGTYCVEQIEAYEAYDPATGESIAAYLARVGDKWYKVPPVGCRAIRACADDIMSQIDEFGHINMVVKKVRGRVRDYKQVIFTA